MIVAQLSYWSVSYRQLATGSLFAYIVHRRNPQHVMSSVTWFLCDLSNCVSVLWTIVAFLLFFFLFFLFISHFLLSFDRTPKKKRITSRTRKDWIEHCRITQHKGTSNISVIFIMIGNFLPLFLKCDNSRTFYFKGRPTVKTCRWKKIFLKIIFSLYRPSFFYRKSLDR